MKNNKSMYRGTGRMGKLQNKGEIFSSIHRCTLFIHIALFGMHERIPKRRTMA